VKSRLVKWKQRQQKVLMCKNEPIRYTTAKMATIINSIRISVVPSPNIMIQMVRQDNGSDH